MPISNVFMSDISCFWALNMSEHILGKVTKDIHSLTPAVLKSTGHNANWVGLKIYYVYQI